MVKLVRKYENYWLYESIQNKEDLRAYLGDSLYNDYMAIKDKLPNIRRQFENIEDLEDLSEYDRNGIKKLIKDFNKLVSLISSFDDSHYEWDTTVDDLLNNVNDCQDAFITIYTELREDAIFYYDKMKEFDKLKTLSKDFIKNFVSDFQSSSEIRRTFKVDGATKLYEDSDWIVIRILSYPAAQYYGSGTKWCISGRDGGQRGHGEGYFQSYIDKYNLDDGYYFYLNKKDPSEKYCLLQSKGGEIVSIWDAEDINRGKKPDDLEISLPKVKGINL